LVLPGNEVAGYRKKLLSLHATAYVTVELNGDQLWQWLFTISIFDCVLLLFPLFVVECQMKCHGADGATPLPGQTLVFATIRKQSMMQLESSANIYIHEVNF